jgi:hypothetical protein
MHITTTTARRNTNPPEHRTTGHQVLKLHRDRATRPLPARTRWLRAAAREAASTSSRLLLSPFGSARMSDVSNTKTPAQAALRKLPFMRRPAIVDGAALPTSVQAWAVVMRPRSVLLE